MNIVKFSQSTIEKKYLFLSFKSLELIEYIAARNLPQTPTRIELPDFLLNLIDDVVHITLY